MDESFLVLLGLGLVALVLIGFFTVLSWFARLFFGAPAKPSVKLELREFAQLPQLQCASCGAAQQPEDLFCSYCGAALPADTATELTSARRVLRRLLKTQRIDEATFQRVWQALEVASAPPEHAQPVVAEQIPQALVSLPTPPPESQAAAPQPQVKFDAPAPTPEPRRSFTEMLTAFMEESSIRWGELGGGLLIVGCSLALVVSLWAQIAERPILKFGVFLTLIVGLFGLGFYSAHRWKLPTTSRGVLLTATLLVPLNFLAIAAFGRATMASPAVLLAEAVTWLGLAGLVWLAARVVAVEQQPWLTAGTMWAALALLLAKHLAPAGLNWRSWLLLGALPVLGYVASVGGAARAARRTAEISAAHAYGLFAVLGVNLFAALLPLSLLQLRAGNWTRAVRENAPLLALLSLPALAVGWLLWRRLHTTALARERTIAASLGLSGVALLSGSALLAFPFVDSLIAIACLNVALFGWVAWHYELRWSRWVALAQAIWGYALLAQLALGRLALGMDDAQRLLAAVLSYASSVSLLAVFIVLFGLSEWWRKQAVAHEKHIARAQDYSWAARLVGLLSLLLAILHGWGSAGDPKRLVGVLGFYALAAFVWAWRRASVPGIWLGWLLLFGVSAQTCVFKYGWPQGWRHAWIVSWLSLAVTASLTSLLTVWRDENARRLWCRPALQVAWGGALWASVSMLASSQGLQGWYVMPLLLVSVTCVVYAWRFAAHWAAAAGGVLFNAAVTIGYVIWALSQGDWQDTRVFPRLAQLNLLTGAVYALGWQLGLRRIENNRPQWLRIQVRVLQGLAFALLLAAALRLSLSPRWASTVVQTLGDGLGWLVFAALAASVLAARQHGAAALRVHKLALSLLSFSTLLACTLHRYEQANWLGFHTLLAAFVAVAWLLLWLALWAQRGVVAEPPHTFKTWLGNLLDAGGKPVADAATRWANGLSVVIVLLSLRGFDAPGGPWRSVLALAGVAALQTGLAVARGYGAYFYTAALLACLALTEWLAGYRKDGSLLEIGLLNVSVLAAVALLSLWLELKVLRASAQAQNSVPAFHQFASVLLLALTGLKVVVGLNLDFSGAPPLPVKGWVAGEALVSVVGLCVACLWDALFASRFAVLFVTGLATVGALVDRQNLPAQRLLVVGTLALSGYALCVSQVWRQRAKLASSLAAVRVPALAAARNAQPFWLLRAQASLVAAAVISALTASFTVVGGLPRWFAAVAALLAPLAVGWLTRMAETSGVEAGSAVQPAAALAEWQAAHRRRWQTVTLVLELGALTALFWRVVNLQGYSDNTNRAVVLLVLLLSLALTFFGARAAEVVAWRRVLNDWEDPARHVLFGAGLFGVGLLVLLLFFEWTQTLASGFVPLGWWAKAALTTTWLALCVSSVAFALWRGRDPFELQSEQRGRYVYAAEIFVVLLLTHLRLSAPWLFGGMFKQYWPLVVLALAFAGVGVAEQLRRRGRVVLAEPLARTGVFLPLLPSLAFWLPSEVVASRVDYAGLLLLVGLFYGVLSVLRRSFGFGLLAALAANGGWWHWLQRTEDYGFLAHPQVWLIPAALSVMAAAHFNRAQLAREQLTAFRYAALITIYVSSTADIFIHGVATSPWLPLVLAVLSVAGVLLGMLMRVRAYLFLGTAFLLLAVITMVWHAALSLGWGWLWYVSGIVFGVFILYLFALFERRRAEVMDLMERLKAWEG